MSLYYGLVALDLARERARDLERAATDHRLLREATYLRGDAQPPRPDAGIRALVARPVRAFSAATHVVSEVARVAATRIEGRTA
jgi:hypothetical protein